MKPSEVLTAPLQVGSALRGRRVFHPLGVLASGHLERTAASGVGLPVESGDVLARVSKAIGIPAGLPDLIGLAVKMPPGGGADRPWDLLFVSAGSGPLTRFALRPVTNWSGTTLSTLMPLRRADEWWWVKATVTTDVGGALSLDGVRAAITGSGLAVEVEQARGAGRFEPLAELLLTTVVPTDAEHDVCFDPTRNTRPGVTLGPAWLTAVRESAYRLSRRGRHAPDDP